jgi:hypothetical protein
MTHGGCEPPLSVKRCGVWYKVVWRQSGNALLPGRSLPQRRGQTTTPVLLLFQMIAH